MSRRVAARHRTDPRTRSAVEEAIEDVRRRFPFPQHMERGDEPYWTLAETVVPRLSAGSRVIDFGAGACDKTAVLQALGFRCVAYDDLQDPWHLLPGNGERIRGFAAECGIELHVSASLPEFEPSSFDLVTVLNVLEHLHDSPQGLLRQLVELLAPGGYLLVTVPNAANIRKRIDLLRGRTNLPPFEEYFLSNPPWRGHVREYVRDDLERLSRHLGLEVVELRSHHHMLDRLPPRVEPFYRAATRVFPGWRDSWSLLVRKPEEWAEAAGPSFQDDVTASEDRA